MRSNFGSVVGLFSVLSTIEIDFYFLNQSEFQFGAERVGCALIKVVFSFFVVRLFAGVFGHSARNAQSPLTLP